MMNGGEGIDFECVAKPRTHATRVYNSLVDIYDFCENQMVKNYWELEEKSKYSNLSSDHH